MDKLKGFTFEPFCVQGTFLREAAFNSLKRMKETTGANFVIFAPCGIQKNAYSEKIRYQGDFNVTDTELEQMLTYAKELGLKTALKPTVNCADGTWRAHINFFDEDVVCEPKWGNWFQSYREFQVHYAKIAEKHQCEMFIAGCEMVMSERQEQAWRSLLADIRQVYKGVLSYNTDKYQEHNVKWWDAVDAIASSGYYPKGDWENQLDRIERVVKAFDKPFLFAETGCMSIKGSAAVPNDWEIDGEYDEAEQAAWYREMFEACQKRPWISGLVLWDWRIKDGDTILNKENNRYDVQGKAAEAVVKKAFE